VSIIARRHKLKRLSSLRQIKRWVVHWIQSHSSLLVYHLFGQKTVREKINAQRKFLGQNSPRIRILQERDFTFLSGGSWQSDAEKILPNQFHFLGTQGLWNSRIDWQLDVLGEKRWALRYYKLLEPVFEQGPHDGKIPYELSRFQHLPTLAIAFQLTKDTRYLQAIVMQIRDWNSKNPYLYGVNWTCAMEVALRAANWILTVDLLGGLTDLPTEFADEFITSLFYHGYYIEHHIETYQDGITTNHTLSDYFGLLILGCALSPAPLALRWREIGWQNLQREMRVQVTDDGADYEGSIPYHRLAFEIFFYSYLIAQQAKLTVFPEYRDRLEKMAEFVLAYTRPDGLAPQIGDNDDGRVFIVDHYLDWDRRDHRYLLGLAAAVFERADFKCIAGDMPIEIPLFLGDTGSRRFESIESSNPEITSRAYPTAGYYLLRSERLWVWVNAHPCGTRGMGNHTHNDLASFELCVDGKPLIVDPGSYTYTRDPQARFEFRRTQAHNTLVIDDMEQNPMSVESVFGIAGLFIAPQILEFRDDSQETVLTILHKGYERLSPPVKHIRTFRLDKLSQMLHIHDKIESNGSHRLAWYFHLDAGVRGEIDSSRAILASDGVAAELVNASGMNWQLFPGWVSYAYNQKSSALVICAEGIAKGSISLEWKIVPHD